MLTILVINYAPLFELFKNLEIQATFGAILAFLTLVSGSAIGFLVAQVWWSQYHKHGSHYYYKKEPRESIEQLIKKYGLTPATTSKDKTSIHNVLTVYSFILFSQQKEDPELVRYLIRRGDTFHSFSATKMALLLGLLVGFVVRVISQLFIFKWNYTEPFADFVLSVNNSALAEVIILLLFIVSVISLIFLFKAAIDHIVIQYNKMAVVLINKSKIKRCELEQVFPKNQNYFDPKWKTENST